MNQSLTHKIKRHKGMELFNYDLAVDWAIELLKDGIETENVLILASFSKPVDSQEIRPYVSAALTELGIDEQEAIEHPIPHIGFYIEQIIEGQDIRINIKELFALCLHYGYDYGLTPFYLLHYAWQDLETEGINYYYEGATLENIEGLSIKEAIIWRDKYVLKKEKDTAPNKTYKQAGESADKKVGALKKIWSRLTGKCF